MPDIPTLTAHQLEVLRRVPSAPGWSRWYDWEDERDGSEECLPEMSRRPSLVVVHYSSAGPRGNQYQTRRYQRTPLGDRVVEAAAPRPTHRSGLDDCGGILCPDPDD